MNASRVPCLTRVFIILRKTSPQIMALLRKETCNLRHPIIVATSHEDQDPEKYGGTHGRTRHATNMIKSFHTYECVTSHTWLSHVREWRMYTWRNTSRYTWLSHVTYTNVSRHTHAWVISHLQISCVYILHIYVTPREGRDPEEDEGVQTESYHTYNWALSHV